MEAKLQALKVPELKKLLQDANLPVSGTKAELIKRLLESPDATSGLVGEGAEEEDLLGEYEAEAPKQTEPAPTLSSAGPPAAVAATTPAKKEESSTTAGAGAAPEGEKEEDKKAALVAELEKRKARAARWGLSTGEAEAKLERAIKFGVESIQDKTLSALDGGLTGGKRREDKAEKKAAGPDAGPKKAAETAPKKAAEKAPVSAETEEEKAARIARQEADEAAKRKRAERFGLTAPAGAAATPASTGAAKSPSVDPAEEEKKRKRMEKFATASAEVSGGDNETEGS